jgi:hypothetical protein
METFKPEFAAFWLSDADTSADRHGGDAGTGSQSLSPSQQVALEELAERVSAARSVL